MATIPIYSIDGKKSGGVQVKDELFDVRVKEEVVHSAVVAYLAGQRRGQARTKRQHEVAGGGRKPWKQKGTGRARAGSSASPLWRHGGVAHGPDGRSYSMALPKKVLRNALRGALTAKRQQGEILVVNKLELPAPRTKDGEKILGKLNLEGKTLVVISNADENIRKSFRNIQRVRIRDVLSLNTYDVLDCSHMLIDKGSLELLEKRMINKAGSKLKA